MKTLLSFVSLFCITAGIYAQTPGTVDESFVTGCQSDGVFYCGAVQPDGKILLGGIFNTFDNYASENILRLNADLTIDYTFATADAEEPYSIIRKIVLQPDGKILIAGDFTKFNGVNRKRIARLNTDGTLDLSFNPGGGANKVIYDIALTSEGKIMIAGDFSTYAGNTALRVARINTDGSFDATFNAGAGADKTVYAVALQPDNKVLIGGEFKKYNNMNSKYLARLNTDGSFDNAFHTATGAGPDSYVTDIDLQSDNKIIAAGLFENFSGISKKNIVRLNTDGSLDNTFTTVSTAGFMFFEPLEGVYIADGDKLYVTGGFDEIDGEPASGYARLNSDGTLDTGFALFDDMDLSYTAPHFSLELSDHKVMISGEGGYYAAAGFSESFAVLQNDGNFYAGGICSGGLDLGTVGDLAIQPDGKVLIAAGYSMRYDNVYQQVCLVRVNTDGTQDTTFVPDFTFPDAGSFGIEPRRMKIHDDGKISLCGNDVLNEIYLRFNTDGSQDTNFILDNPPYRFSVVRDMLPVADGKILLAGAADDLYHIKRLKSNDKVDGTFPIGTFSTGSVYMIAMQPDDKLIVVTSCTTYNGLPIHTICRINPNGSLDTGFHPGSGSSVHSNGNLVILEDGKILLSMDVMSSFDGVAVNQIIRLNSDGTLDSTFNVPAIDVIDPSGSFAVQQDGKIIVTTESDYTDYQTIGVKRLNTDGSIDNTFYDHAETNSYYYFSQMYTALDADDRIYVAGEFSSFDHSTHNGIVRLNNSTVCAAPSGLFADNISSTKAKLHWDAVATAIKYQVYYRIVGDGSWLKKTSTVNTRNLTGLMPNSNYEYKVRTDCGEGYTEFSAIANFTTLPMKESGEAIHDITIYPNPANDILYIDGMDNNSVVEIFDMQGNNMRTISVEHGEAIDISAFSSGNYIIRITNNTVSITKHFIKP